MKKFPFPDRITSKEEIKRDVIYNKIPKDEIDSICEYAWERGVHTADKTLNKCGKVHITEIIKQCGLTIETVEKDNVAGNIRFFSEYYSKRKTIYLYRHSIEMWADKNDFTYNSAVELILSHEFYHYLECEEIGLTSKKYIYPTLKIGKFVLFKSGVKALSEIGAHGFSRRYYEAMGKIEPELESNSKLYNHATNANYIKGKALTDKILLKGGKKKK